MKLYCVMIEDREQKKLEKTLETFETMKYVRVKKQETDEFNKLFDKNIREFDNVE